MEYLEVDGSMGEGGGQVLRTALVFSIVKRLPVRISKIRAGRDEPGLKKQHLSAITILSEIFGASVSGASEGSTDVSFDPQAPRASELAVDMQTAASITLVLQAVVPAVSLSGHTLSLELRGGTDVPWSPTFDYFTEVAKKGYKALGIDYEATVSRRGYYPKGGGRVVVRVSPSRGVTPIDLPGPARPSRAVVVSRCSELPRHVADRQMKSAREELERASIVLERAEVEVEGADSPGSSVLVYAPQEGVFLGADSIGRRGRPAELVGQDAGARFVAAAKSGSTLDQHAADMLTPLLSLAPGPSRVRIPSVTSHLETGMALAKQFTSATFRTTKSESGVLVTVEPL